MKNLSFCLILAFLTVITVGSAQAQSSYDQDSYNSYPAGQSTSVLGGVLNTMSQSRTLQGGLIGGAIGKIAGGRTGIFKNSDEGAAAGVLLGAGYGAWRDNRAMNKAKLEAACRAGDATPNQCAKLLPREDREQYNNARRNSRRDSSEASDKETRSGRGRLEIVDDKADRGSRDAKSEENDNRRNTRGWKIINNSGCTVVMDDDMDLEDGEKAKSQGQRIPVMRFKESGKKVYSVDIDPETNELHILPPTKKQG